MIILVIITVIIVAATSKTTRYAQLDSAMHIANRWLQAGELTHNQKENIKTCC